MRPLIDRLYACLKLNYRDCAGCWPYSASTRMCTVMWGSSSSTPQLEIKKFVTLKDFSHLSTLVRMQSTRLRSTHIALLRCPLSIHNHNMDSVLLLCHIMVCSNESPGYNPLQHRPGNKASDWPAGDEAFLWPVSIPGGCVCARSCVRAAAAVFSLILRHIVWYLQQHSTFYPPYSLAPLPTHSTAAEKRRRGICIVYSYCPASPALQEMIWPQDDLQKLPGDTTGLTL